VNWRKDLAPYLAHGLTCRQLWAANGSNEVSSRFLSASSCAGRSALGFEASYTIAPSHRWHRQPVDRRAAEPDFPLDPAAAVAAIESPPARRVFLTSPEQPDLAPPPRCDLVEAIVDAAARIVVIDRTLRRVFAGQPPPR